MDMMSGSEVARALGLSAERVRQLADAGVIPVAMIVTERGMRLYRRGDVERIAAERADREAAKRAAVA
jgi:DNA-binding transcriptional MerR regulator